MGGQLGVCLVGWMAGWSMFGGWMIWTMMTTATMISGEGGRTTSTSVFDTTTNLWLDAFLAGRGGDFDHRLVESEVKAEGEVKAEEEEEAEYKVKAETMEEEEAAQWEEAQHMEEEE